MSKLLECPTCGRAGFNRELGRCLYCGDTIPRLLTERDPHNSAHITAALQLLQRLTGFSVLKQNVAEIRALKLPIPKNTKVVTQIDLNDVAVGMPYLLEQGLLLSTNVIKTCRTCRAPIQFRPAIAHSQAIHLCVFCAVDRALHAHWSGVRASPSP